jgi:hypothetical protein
MSALKVDVFILHLFELSKYDLLLLLLPLDDIVRVVKCYSKIVY